jgi:hypothetical protein
MGVLGLQESSITAGCNFSFLIEEISSQINLHSKCSEKKVIKPKVAIYHYQNNNSSNNN